jgi:hypothetical protein
MERMSKTVETIRQNGRCDGRDLKQELLEGLTLEEIRTLSLTPKKYTSAVRIWGVVVVSYIFGSRKSCCYTVEQGFATSY